MYTNMGGIDKCTRTLVNSPKNTSTHLYGSTLSTLAWNPSKNANAEKKAAFAALGKDESDVDRERWESETSNIQYGLDYIRSLQDAGNIEKIIEVCKELLVYEKYNTTILRSLGDAYLNLYKEDEALNIYNTLAKVDPTNYDVAIDISKILVNKEKFSQSI